MQSALVGEAWVEPDVGRSARDHAALELTTASKPAQVQILGPGIALNTRTTSSPR
jgi:hypothetical protein